MVGIKHLSLVLLSASLTLGFASCSSEPKSASSLTVSDSIGIISSSGDDSELGSDSSIEQTDSEDDSGDTDETGTETGGSATEAETQSDSADTIDETVPDTALDDTDTGGSETAVTDTANGTDTGSETETVDTDTGPDMSPKACRPYVGLRDDALLEALYNTVRGHESQGYDHARYLMFTDVELFDGKVEGIYSGRSLENPEGIPSAGSPDYFNTEHSWPQSQFDKDEPARSDLHQLFASDTRVNNARSNYDFGDGCPVSTETSCEWACDEQNIWAHDCVCDQGAGASRVIECQGKSRYEVRPERRGDIARAHFYMVARYRFDTSVPIDDDDKGILGCIDDDRCINDNEEAVLRRWHENDPVDDRERTRNDRIEVHQKNRNPFVDCPALVELVGNF